MVEWRSKSMNEKVRDYLITVARQKEKFVFYSEVVKDCGLNIDLGFPPDHERFSNLLKDVSKFEFENGRPLITALVMYKDVRKNDHGRGFYKLANELGFGKAKDLQDSGFAVEEADKCRRFWQNEANYKMFSSLKNVTAPKSEIEFFGWDELEFFKKWQYKAYNPDDDEHVEAKTILMDSVWEKSVHLGRRIVAHLENFQSDGRKYWSQRGWKEDNRKEDNRKNVKAAIFKPYTWIKIFREDDRGKDIFFTFGIDAYPGTEAFIYKIDCQNKRDIKLTQTQIDLCRSLIPETAKGNSIAFEDLVKENWDSLTTTCLNFIHQHIDHYDAIINAVWGHPILLSLFRNKLIKREKPKDGFDTMPETNKSFRGVDVDFYGKAKEQKDIGDAGEALVKQREINFLKEKGLHEKASLVQIVKDGKGYDILSFDENGNEKYVEVKTTTGNEHSPFFLSDNEVEFMRSNENQYYIYRVYNYDKENNFAEYFELTDNVENQLIMEPTHYKVLIKKTNL